MARVIEMSGRRQKQLAEFESNSYPLIEGEELGQINIGPVSIGGPAKIRLQWNFLPDVTIDLAAIQPQGASSWNLMSLLKPKATVLFGGSAYLIDPSASNTISEGDPNIFNTPTMLDVLSSYGPVVTLMLLGIFGYAGYVAGVLVYDKFFAKKLEEVK